MATRNASESPPAAEEHVALRARVAQLEAALAAAAEREERARLELVALRAAEHAFVSVFEHAPLGIVIGSLNDSLLRTNRAFEQITGYSADDVVRLTVPGITHPDDYPREVALIEELLAGRRTHYQLEKRYLHKDGHSVPVMITGLLVRGGDGAPEACVALVEDLTERTRAEETRGFLAAILEATPDLVGYAGLDGTLQYLNRSWRRMRAVPDGADLAAIDGASWQPAWAHELTRAVGVPAALAAGAWQGETVVYDGAGAEVPVRQTILALRDRHGEPARLATVLHDLRGERRAARERMALERKLLEAQRLESLGVMAAGIAHDFNNILTTIIGNADLALLNPALDRPTRRSLQAVLDGAHRAAELTRQILAYAGKGQMQLQPTDLSLTVAGLAEQLRGTAGPQSRLTISAGAGLPPVAADGAQLRQVLLNLVANAGEAIEAAQRAGAVDVRTGVEQLDRAALDGLIHGAELPAGTYVRLTVEDDGCGMDAATAARSFDPFFSTRFLGRGLGLAAVQGIVRAHNGAMGVVSTPGAGTSFSIWLPALAPGEHGRGGGERPGRRGSALLLVADPAAREQLAGLLRQLDMRVVAAADGAAALAHLAAGLPELEAAIIDQDTPGLRAELVAQAVGATRPGTPVLRVGAGGLRRPVTIEALREALARKGAPG